MNKSKVLFNFIVGVLLIFIPLLFFNFVNLFKHRLIGHYKEHILLAAFVSGILSVLISEILDYYEFEIRENLLMKGWLLAIIFSFIGNYLWNQNIRINFITHVIFVLIYGVLYEQIVYNFQKRLQYELCHTF